MKTKQLQTGWGEVELRDVFDLKYGSSLPESKRIRGNIEVYGSNGVVGFHNKGITKGQTIIVGRKGSIGKINLSNKTCFPIDTTYYIDETKISCDIKWLFYILKTLHLDKLNRAAAVPGLNRNDVYGIKILFPPLGNQKKIVSILERAEQLKEKRKQTITYLDDYLKGVFSEIFLRKKFEIKEIFELCETSSGGTPSRVKSEYWENGKILWVKSGELDRGYIYDTEEKITEEGLKNSSTKYFEPGAVLIAMYGASVGKVSLLKVKATTNQAVCSLIPRNNSKLNNLYLLYFLKSIKKKLISSSFGGGQPNISQNLIKSTKIPLPPIALQQKFASIVEHVEKLKEKQKQSLEEIEKLSGALTQKAFRGDLV